MFKKLLFGSAFLLASGAALASGGGPDVSAATDGFTQVGAAVNSIGPVMLTAAAAGIVYKWVTAFLI